MRPTSPERLRISSLKNAGEALLSKFSDSQPNSPRKKCHGLKVPVSAIYMVCITVFIDSLGGSISAPVLPYYGKEFGITNEEVGILFSSFALSQVICLPLLGIISDRIGRRKVLVASLFGAAIGAFAQGYAPNVTMLVLARIVSGAFAAVGSTANVYVSDVTNEDNRCKYLGYLMSANGLAFAFGPGLGGGLSRFGMNVPIIVNGVLSIVAGLLSIFYLPENPAWLAHQEEAARKSVRHTTTTGGMVSTSVLKIAVAEFMRGLSFSAIFAMFGVYAMETYGLDSIQIGFAVCFGALIFICTNIWICTGLQCTLGDVGTASFGTLTMSLGHVIIYESEALQGSLIGMWIVYLGQAVAGCTIAAIAATVANDDNRGWVMSVQQMAQALGRVVGPWSLGYLSDRSARLPFLVAALTALVAAICTASLHQAYRRHSVDLDLDVDVSPSPPSWPDEMFTEEDVVDLGNFLCKLLTSGHYRWRDEKERKNLKQMLRDTFPPLNSNGDALVLKCGTAAQKTNAGLSAARVLGGIADASSFSSPVQGNRRAYIRSGSKTNSDLLVNKRETC